MSGYSPVLLPPEGYDTAMRLCGRCGQPGTDERPLSARGYHAECSEALVRENIEQLRARSGPYWRRWRERHAAAVGGIVPDLVPPPADDENTAA